MAGASYDYSDMQGDTVSALLGFHVCVFEDFLIVHDREHLLCLMFVR